jgi:hypothetical protein
MKENSLFNRTATAECDYAANQYVILLDIHMANRGRRALGVRPTSVKCLIQTVAANRPLKSVSVTILSLKRTIGTVS